jgi:aminoglycoside 6'-N-acetyltransferase I
MIAPNQMPESTRNPRTESGFNVRLAQVTDQNEIAKMCALLWPEASIEEHHKEIGLLLASGMCGSLPGAIFTSYNESSMLNGFLQVGLRSHADGCDPSQPVGFVEGWFVHKGFRGLGIGKALMHAAEVWARHRGCKEMASDTWIDHMGSHKAHEALGFELVDRCVHYRKEL